MNKSVTGADDRACVCLLAGGLLKPPSLEDKRVRMCCWTGCNCEYDAELADADVLGVCGCAILIAERSRMMNERRRTLQTVKVDHYDGQSIYSNNELIYELGGYLGGGAAGV